MDIDIGNKLKNLRIQKELTQEELGERTDLTKGYISQLERGLSSPSMETFFQLLEVLGCTPQEFFSEEMTEQKVVYSEEDRVIFEDLETGYVMEWLVSESNENEMEPILLLIMPGKAYKQFSPSQSETFIWVLSGTIQLKLGSKTYQAREGESLYYISSDVHQLFNESSQITQLLVVVTHSYL